MAKEHNQMNWEVLYKLVDEQATDSPTSKVAHHVHDAKDKQKFIQQCWKMLDKEVQAAYSEQLDNLDSQSKIQVKGIDIAGVSGLAFDLKRALNSYENLDAAVINFEHLNLSKHALHQSPFTDENVSKLFKEKLNAYQSFKKHSQLVGKVSTNLSTVHMSERSSEENERVFEIAAKLIDSAITTTTMGVKRLDSHMVDKNNQLSSNLIPAIAIYVDKNFDKLQNMRPKDLAKVGKELKKGYLKELATHKKAVDQKAGMSTGVKAMEKKKMPLDSVLAKFDSIDPHHLPLRGMKKVIAKLKSVMHLNNKLDPKAVAAASKAISKRQSKRYSGIS